MKLIHFANKNHVGLLNLTHSLQPGWEQIILGMGIKWEGWKTRMKAYKDYLETLPSDEVVVLSDAYDVLCLRSSQEFLSTFSKFQKPIVIGAETQCDLNCHAPTHYWEQCDIKGDRKYVNGGLMCGKARHLCDMWKWCLEKKFEDDQVGLGHYTDTFPDLVGLDVDSNLFFNDHRAITPYQFDSNTYALNYQNKVLTPFFIHFHGVNIMTSIPILHVFREKDMFQVGKNYKVVGNQINGFQHITAFPPDQRSLQLDLTIERICFWVVIGLLLLLCLYLAVKRRKS